MTPLGESVTLTALIAKQVSAGDSTPALRFANCALSNNAVLARSLLTIGAGVKYAAMETGFWFGLNPTASP